MISFTGFKNITEYIISVSASVTLFIWCWKLSMSKVSKKNFEDVMEKINKDFDSQKQEITRLAEKIDDKFEHINVNLMHIVESIGELKGRNK